MNLLPHQQQLCAWATRKWKRDPSWSFLLADKPGAGKTRSCLAALQARAECHAPQRPCVLVVCVPNQEFHWIREAKLVAPLLCPDRAVVMSRLSPRDRKTLAERRPRCVLTSIHMLASEYQRCCGVKPSGRVDMSEHGPRLTAAQRAQSFLMATEWDMVVVDEPTFLFKPFWHSNGPQARACYELQRRACILLNGTLAYNRLTDLAGQVHMLGTHPYAYREWWLGVGRPLRKEDKQSPGPVGVSDPSHAQGPRGPEALHDLLRDCVYRSTVPRLPVDMTVEIETFELTERQEHILATLRSQPPCMATLTDMALATVDPRLVDGSSYDYGLRDSPKLHHLVTTLVPRILREVDLDHQQIVVFGRFHVVLEAVNHALQEVWPKEFGKPALALDSSTTSKHTERILTCFAERSKAREAAHKPWWSRVLLLTYEKGKVGLNLQAACHVVQVDPTWSPAADQQAIQRCWRMGQTRNVTVYRLMCSDPRTPDHWVWTHCQSKRRALKGVDTSTNGFPHESDTTDLEWDEELDPKEAYADLFNPPQKPTDTCKTSSLPTHSRPSHEYKTHVNDLAKAMYTQGRKRKQEDQEPVGESASTQFSDRPEHNKEILFNPAGPFSFCFPLPWTFQLQ